MRRGLCLILLAAGCAGCAGGAGPRGGEALRLSDLDRSGDPTRRASLRLCLDGLEADAAGRAAAAQGSYDRAIQIDPTNPYAYLVLARHTLDEGDPGRALEHLAQAEALLDAESARWPSIEPHLIGLRGAALRESGRGGARELEQARRLAPDAWSDGHLDAEELR